MTLPGLEEKVAFLSRPEAYPDRVRCVEKKQTHMSWIFLTDTEVWKLKKPVHTEYLNFSTLKARRRNCETEVRLNRRLASDVYRGVVPLTSGNEGDLQLGGPGKPVDWLVRMRRLPSDRMLDHIIARRAVSAEDVLKLTSMLAAFYKSAQPIRITGSQYWKRLAAHLEDARTELIRTEHGLFPDLVESSIAPPLKFLAQHRELFDSRVRAGKIIEAHGDLRPEHICLERPPVIIDCLEFNRDLRIVDAASELTFLALECERLGAPGIEKLMFRKYSDDTGDWPSTGLRAFYKRYHACVRAKIAICHFKDGPMLDRATWIAKANRYLEMVSEIREPATA